MKTEIPAVTDLGKAPRFTIVDYSDESGRGKLWRVWDNHFDCSASGWFAVYGKAESAITRASTYVTKHHGRSLVA